MKRVVVLDYGSGNLRSVERALAAAGAAVEVSADRELALEAAGLVVPGVGAFAACMRGLSAVGGDELVTSRLRAERPVLGICVGMQALFDYGVEHGERTPGLGLLTGEVHRLRAPVVPHMGWNTVQPAAGSRLFAGLEGERFYFLHSYAAKQDQPGAAVTWATHGEPFVAAVERGPLAAAQFHPEKSGAAGTRMLTNWLECL